MDREMYLVLENGEVFKGKSFGAEAGGADMGEVVFTTGMAGYLETLTDPSYCGQIVVQTFPLIGNYGLIPSDFESRKCYLKAYIVREWCQEPSNFRSEGAIDTFLKEQGVIGLYGLDTRRLTRVLRENGTMNGCIVAEEKEIPGAIERAKAYHVEGLVREATCPRNYVEGSDDAKYRVTILDLGMTDCFKRYLIERGAQVHVVNAYTKAEEILAQHPDGILLSNGPGSSKAEPEIVAEVKKLAESGVPIMGIDLGHLMLASAMGGGLIKLKHGHRGANQPVRYLPTDRVYISSQNHGYAVSMDALPQGAEVTFVNLNDGSCEGLLYKKLPALSVQFRPGNDEGMVDTGFLFDQFMKMMEVDANAAE